MENNDQFLNEPVDPEWEVPYSPDEMKRIRKHLRRHNWKIILTSVVLAAALLLGTVYVAIPFAEKQYWDPTTVSFGTEDVTDFDVTLDAFKSLFCPDINIHSTEPTHIGFATYAIDVGVSSRYERLTIEKGQLSIPKDFWFTHHYGSFRPLSSPYFEMNEEAQIEKLQQLPEYIMVSAYVTFQQDLSIGALRTFTHKVTLLGGYTEWAAIRHSDEMLYTDTICCFDIVNPNPDYNGINEYYPSLYLDYTNNTTEGWKAHFKSLLRYSNDQYQAGTGIEPPNDPNFYENTLNYVEENGVYSYGCYVTASPSEMLEIWEMPEVAWIDLNEAEINIH